MTTYPNVYTPPPHGSYDWAGGTAPAIPASNNTGVSTITMLDGAQFVVASSPREIHSKRDEHAIAKIVPNYVYFPQLNTAQPIGLCLQNMVSVVGI